MHQTPAFASTLSRKECPTWFGPIAQPCAFWHCRPSAARRLPGPLPGRFKSTASRWAQTPEGTVIEQFTMSNAGKTQIRVLTYGATLTAVMLPDRDGQVRNVTLYLDTWRSTCRDIRCSGLSSVALRIALHTRRFEIAGQPFDLDKNMGGHHIHGGNQGFQTVNWRAQSIEMDDRAGVELTHTSPDGHAGYPGTLEVRVQYLLTDDNRLVMEYWAKTDQPTHLNLTNHAYWNLAGAGAGDVLDHLLLINADKCVVADAQRFPTGEIRPVAGTPLDFRTPHRVGERIGQVPDQNYDDCYVLNKTQSRRADVGSPRRRSRERSRHGSVHDATGRPALHSQGSKRSAAAGSGAYGPYHGLCLETQHFPDSPNQPQFPTTLLQPGEEFHQITIHKFFTE